MTIHVEELKINKYNNNINKTVLHSKERKKEYNFLFRIGYWKKTVMTKKADST